MTNHIIGKEIDGILHRFDRRFSDADFEEIQQNGLPPGWVAWHVEDGASYLSSSPRVRAIHTLLLVTKPSRLSDGTIHFRSVEPLDELRQIWDKQSPFDVVVTRVFTSGDRKKFVRSVIFVDDEFIHRSLDIRCAPPVPFTKTESLPFHDCHWYNGRLSSLELNHYLETIGSPYRF